jgi:hypothetical protein
MPLFSSIRVRRDFYMPILCLLAMLGTACTMAPAKPELPLQKAIVLPVSTLHKELRGDAAIVQNQLAEALNEAGYDCYVITVQDFEQLQRKAFDESGSIYNPSVGEYVALDDARYRNSLLRQLRARGAFDVMVVPELMLRAARIQGNVISWDGVSRDLEVRGQSKYLMPREARGLSLLVNAYGNNGGLAAKGIGGITVPFYLDARSNDTQFRLREAFYDVGEVSEGVDLAVKAFQRK